MPRPEDGVWMPVHTRTRALQERVRFPTQTVYIDDVYSTVEGTQDQPFVETQSQAVAIGRPSLGNQGLSLLPYCMSSFDHIDDEYESRYLFPTSRRQANPPYHGAELVHPMVMEMIHLGMIELVKVNLGIGIQIGIIQEGMTDWEFLVLSD